MSKRPSQGDSTRAVHGGERERRERDLLDTLATPIFQTSTFRFDDGATVRAYQEGRLAREEYGRYGNPTWRAAEQKLAGLEGAEAALLFASGMAAATTTFLALLPQGGHMVTTSDCYRRTRQFCEEYLAKLGVETTVIEPADTKKLADALRDDTTLFFTESPTNPYLRVIDIPEAVRVCHARGVQVVIDSTFATPINQRALDLGADLVIHSGTKFLGGHNDLLAGAVLGSEATIEPVCKALGVLGPVIDPHAAWLLLRGMKTLDVRMARHNESGQRVAEFLEAQPRVRRVWYPGLASHPDHDMASRLMKGFGAVVTFELDADFAATEAFVDALRIPQIAPSFGGVDALVEMPVSMSFWDKTPEQRRAWGITDSLVRFSCGIEDTEDLIADLAQALGA